MEQTLIKDTLKYIATAAVSDWNFCNHGVVPRIIIDENGDYKIADKPLFKFDISFAKNTIFDGNLIHLNTFHFTMMARQLHDFGTISLRQVHNAWKRIFPDNPLLKSQRTSASFSNDPMLTKEFQHNSVNCYNFTIDIADYGFDKVKYEMELQKDRRLLEIKNMTEDELAVNF